MNRSKMVAEFLLVDLALLERYLFLKRQALYLTFREREIKFGYERLSLWRIMYRVNLMVEEIYCLVKVIGCKKGVNDESNSV